MGNDRKIVMMMFDTQSTPPDLLRMFGLRGLVREEPSVSELKRREIERSNTRAERNKRRG